MRSNSKWWKKGAVVFLAVLIAGTSISVSAPFWAEVTQTEEAQTGETAETPGTEVKEEPTVPAPKQEEKKPELRKDAKGNYYYYNAEGKKDTSFTGVFRWDNKTLYIKNGKWDTTFKGFASSQGKKYFFKKGKCDETYTGLKKYNKKYYYLKKGILDKETTTLARVDGKGNWFYVKNGTIDKSKKGFYKYKGKMYYLKKGTIDKSKKGFLKKGKTWYYFKKGVQDMKTKGLVKKGDTWYYVENGVFDKTYEGRASIKGYPNKFKVHKGKVSGGMVPPTAKLAKAAEKVLKKNGRSLKAAFKWAATSGYRLYDRAGSLGVAHYATHGFKNHYGNCYVMAAVFCVLARELGYEAYQMSGAVNALAGGTTPHSWVEVKVDGKWYVCDPDMTKESGMNGFLRWYGAPNTWTYYSPSRMHD